MFSNLKPYAETGSSTGDWFGRLPEHWAVEAARSLFSEIASTGQQTEPLLSVTIRRGVLPQAGLIADSAKKDRSNVDRSKYKLVLPGDIAYTKMRAWQGAAGLSQYRGVVSPAYVVVRPRRAAGWYRHHLLRTPAFATEAERWSYGISSDQWSLRPEHFKMIRSPLPPASEQEAIVEYLGHVHARIDRAIAAKRRLVALLDEQMLAVIRDAVDRGGDPAVDASGSWPVQALRFRYSQVLGKMLDTGRMTGDHPLPYLRNVRRSMGPDQHS